MELFLSIIVFIAVVAILFPYEVFIKKNKYIKKTNSIKVEKEEILNKNISLMIGLADKIVVLLKLKISDKNREKLNQRIKYAGIQEMIEPEVFYGIKILCFFCVMFLFGMIYLIEPTSLNLFLLVLVSIMGYFIPENWLTMRGKNRQWTIQKELPNVLSSVAVVTDAGFNLIQALEVVVDQNQGVLIQEFKKVLEEIRIGLSIKEAFINLSQRSNVEELNYFVSAIVQGMEKGATGITKIIKEQALESWDKRKHNAKELAEKASMKLFLPLLLLVFPAFMIYLLGPMIFSILDLFNGGL